MSTGINTDMQSILNQLKTQISGLGSSSVGASSGNTQFINSVWGLTEQAQGAIDGNDEQKAQAITGIITNILGILSSLGTNEKSKAKQEVDNNTKKEDQITKNADQSAQTTEEKVKQILSDVANNTTTISEAMSQIEKLGGDDGKLQEAQKELEDQVKIIEENKKILDSDDKVTNKEAALKAIEGASNKIAEICLSITEVQQQIEAQNAVVEDASNNIGTLIEESATTITDGAAKVQGFIQQAGAQTGVATKTGVEGATNEATGQAAQSTAAGFSALPFGIGQAKAQQLIRVGIDQTMAGQTRIQGSATSISKLTKAIGEMGSDLQNITSYVGQAQELGNKAVDLIGLYDAQLQPLITATGSWQTVADANVQLVEAVQEYRAENGMEETKVTGFYEGASNVKSQENNQNVDYLNPWGSRTENKQETAENQNDKNGKFNFDPEIFRTAFGV